MTSFQQRLPLLKQWITDVILDPSSVQDVSKEDRREKLEPLSRFINQRTGSWSWSFHHSKDKDCKKILRDPSTRTGFDALKNYIEKNVGLLDENISNREYLHALGYDNLSSHQVRICSRKELPNWGGVRNDEVFLHKEEMESKVLAMVRGGLSKTNAKKEYNKQLYNLLPSHDLSDSDVCDFIGVPPPPPPPILTIPPQTIPINPYLMRLIFLVVCYYYYYYYTTSS